MQLSQRVVVGFVCHRERSGSKLAAASCSMPRVQLHHRMPHRLPGAVPVSRPVFGRVSRHVARVASRDVVRPNLTVQSSSDIIRRFYDAQNRRDLVSLSLLLASDVTYDNLAVADTLQGRTAVSQFYQDSLSSVPPEARFLLDHVTSGDAAQVGVVWRLVLTDSSTVMSRGLSYYCLDADGHIESVIDNPEHAVKLSRASLSFMAPLVKNLSAPVLPALKEATQNLQDGMEQLGLTSLFDPLNQLLGMRFSSSSNSSLSQPSIAGELPERASSSFRVGLPMPRPQQPPAAPSPAPAAAPPRVQSPPPSSRPAPAAAAAAAPAAAPPAAAARQATPAASAAPSQASAPAAAPSKPATSSAAAPAAAAPKPAASSAAAAPAAGARNVQMKVLQPSAAAPAARSSPPAAAAAAAAAASAPAAGQTLVKPAAAPVNLTGLWVLDKEASDAVAYEAALDLLGLSRLQKMTARLIEAVEVAQDAVNFSVNFVTVVPFFKVNERIPFRGSSQLPRRDLRSGKQTATVEVTEQGVRVSMKWGAPLAGGLVEDYTVCPDGSLLVTGVTTIGDRSATVRQVYRRTNLSKDAFLRVSKQKNGDLGAAMRKSAEEDRSSR